MKLACKLPCKTYDKLLSKVAFIILKIILKNMQSLWLTGLTTYLKRREINKKMQSSIEEIFGN